MFTTEKVERYGSGGHGRLFTNTSTYLSIAPAPPDDPVQQVMAHVQVQIARLN